MERGRRKKLTMAARRVLVKAFGAITEGFAKKQKGAILDQVVEAAGYERHYAARLLRTHGRRVVVAPGVMVEGDVGYRIRRRRQRIYGKDEAGADSALEAAGLLMW